ncbi:Rxt3-domain-containing protein [Eremomyces bilateralis CBS 781.70]|uniref:Rxt3-domain-containing protein n=1 Tax=Eremomyces bilateralis CBS 781.70 TaxID=1392243 RepID=A0A6G1FTY2_9PEZI|nr:Rxt3-domain-containing protein [Eremomyces bilateralis CBS 781.70]KAF1809200.1 Rxt3-domain-containing protein [Eremomyces bilateralis CBS 781.70]
MDHRSQQHGASRPSERALIHNPNHHPPSTHPTPSSTAYLPPHSHATAQPQIHMPMSDPFQRRERDPFFPNAPQHQRQGSYGTPGREAPYSVPPERAPLPSWASPAAPASSSTSNLQPLQQHQQQHHHHHHHHPSHLPPPPPPPPSSITSHSAIPGSYEQRRRSIGSASSSNYFGQPPQGAQDPPPPPPPPFTARSTITPSPSATSNPATSRPPPPPPSFVGHHRNMSNPPSSNRAGSGMSISSLLGTDSGRPRTEHRSPPSAPNTAQAPSSPRNPYTAYRHGSEAPFSGSPSQPFNRPTAASPEIARLGHPYSQPHGAPPDNRPFHPPHALDPNERLPPRFGDGPSPPRPNSQPTGYGQPHRDPYKNEAYPPRWREAHYDPHASPGRPTQDQRYGAPREDHYGGPGNDRDRPVTVHPVSQSAYSPPRDARPPAGGASPRDAYGRPVLRQEPPQDPFRDSRRSPEEYRQPPRSVPTPNVSGPGMPPRADEVGRHAGYDQVVARSVEQLHVAQDQRDGYRPMDDRHVSGGSMLDRKAEEPAAGHDPYRPHPYDHPQPLGEEMLRSRSLLGVSPEATRRTGRASPLPQAVQGAQARFNGPGGDPNVKSEFGRMFSGLGGLGGAPGISTPTRQSPMPGEGNGADMMRSGSRGLKPKRPKEDGARRGGEKGDGRGTPSDPSGRAKRTKLNHSAHHHHHHAAPHHHHHHHAGEDAVSVPAPTGSPANLNQFMHKFNSAAAPTAPQPTTTPVPHHHHHIAPTRHHHHNGKSPAAAVTPTLAPPPRPNFKELLQPILSTVAEYPRNHLGDGLYVCKARPPRAHQSSWDRGPTYASVPEPMKDFRSLGAKAYNCTYTIRVPRYYLSAQHREVVCRDGNLWGTEVYTDDSDVLAAAMHSGFIRGEFVDVDDEDLAIIYDLPPGMSVQSADTAAAAAPGSSAAAPTGPRTTPPKIPGAPPSPPAEPRRDSGDTGSRDIITSPPLIPAVPPPERDAHITLQLLPALTVYPPHTRNGIGSRRWGDNHDGISFRVLSVEWVDEGVETRGWERSAKGRKERLRDLLRRNEEVNVWVQRRAVERERGREGRGENGGLVEVISG